MPSNFNLGKGSVTMDATYNHILLYEIYPNLFFKCVTCHPSEDTNRQDNFNYTPNMSQAVTNNTVAEDIKDEQRKVQEADLIIFQFPLQVQYDNDNIYFPGIAAHRTYDYIQYIHTENNRTIYRIQICHFKSIKVITN